MPQTTTRQREEFLRVKLEAYDLLKLMLIQALHSSVDQDTKK